MGAFQRCRKWGDFKGVGNGGLWGHSKGVEWGLRGFSMWDKGAERRLSPCVNANTDCSAVTNILKSECQKTLQYCN